MSTQTEAVVVENGFKETEIGLIPMDWNAQTLKTYCEKPQYGYTESSSIQAIGPKFLRITDITDIGVNWSEVPYCRCPQELIEKYRLKTGDILFARIGATTGKSYLVQECPISIYASYLIRVRTKSGLSPAFLYYFFNSEAYWKQINANKGSNLKMGVNASFLSQLRFPLPPTVTEQQKIATILFKVQRAIELQEKIIEITRELKKSLMNKLFTEGLNGEEQKETEIGLMPKSWKTKKLGEDGMLEMVQYGISVKGYHNGKYPMLRMNNLIEGYATKKNLQFVNIEDKEFKKYKLKVNDVLFNRTNSIDLVGKTGIFNLEGDYIFASYLIRIRTNDKVLNPMFLNIYFNMQSSQERLKELATRGVSQSNISGSRLKTFSIPLPPDIHEQEEIIKIVLAIDTKISQMRAKKQTLQSLFKTMLHKLMTGQIRVKDMDIEVENV